jgi:hypothetical protein
MMEWTSSWCEWQQKLNIYDPRHVLVQAGESHEVSIVLLPFAVGHEEKSYAEYAGSIYSNVFSAKFLLSDFVCDQTTLGKW